MQYKRLAGLVLGSIITTSALAAVSPQEAERLGQDLTPLGAERAGNADGSIPEWSPGSTPIPEGFVPDSGNYLNPYPDEKPLYTIDVNNWKDYAEVLTEGSRAIMEKLGPHGF